MKKPYLSLRNKLLLSILLILLVSYSILLLTTARSFELFLEREVNKDLETSLSFAQNQYYSRAGQIRLFFTQPATAPPAQARLRQGDTVWLNNAVHRWQGLLPFVDVVTVVDPNHRVLARLGKEPARGFFTLTHIVDRAFEEGKTVIATELVPREFLCREGQPAYCTPGRGEPEAMMMTVVIPAVSSSGEVFGAIVAGDVINGDPYYPNEVQKIFGLDVELTITQRERKIASSMHDADFAAVLAPEILATLQAIKGYRGETRIGSKVYRTAFEPICNSRGQLVGSLSVALSRENFRKIRKDNEYNVLVSALVGICLSFAIAYAATRQVTRPLKAISRSVRKIEEGDLTQRVVVHTEDELGMLAESFNRMVRALGEREAIIRNKNHDLQKLNQLLEKKVAGRTAELRMEMERLETVLTSMVEGIVVTDRDNRVIIFNPAAQKLFNLVPYRVLYQQVHRLCEMGGIPALAEEVDLLRTSQDAPAVLERDLVMEGKRLKVNLSRLHDEAAAFAGVVMSVRDVTLEEEVDRMKNEFISTVSHELKTPLTCMKGSLQFIMAKGKWLTTTERDLLAVCLRNTDRLIRLISDILDVSRIEEGGMVLNLKPQYLRSLVTQAIEEIAPLAMERTITIINDIPDDLPPINADHDRLLQVVTNLLSNAVKFSPPAKVVTVFAATEDQYVAVSIADRGTPIAPADRDKLFRKFHRLESGEAGDRGGTGLGLVICKELVEKHHGRIYYHPGAAGGNVFAFTIPVYQGTHES